MGGAPAPRGFSVNMLQERADRIAELESLERRVAKALATIARVRAVSSAMSLPISPTHLIQVIDALEAELRGEDG